MSGLNSAIQLIHDGRKEEARQVLEPLLKAEPANIQAWFWYIETCSTLEKRIQVLEVCLKMNPGNSEVMHALQMLRSQQPRKTSFAPPSVESPKPAVSEPLQRPSPYSVAYTEESEDLAPYSHAPAYFDDQPANYPAWSSSAQAQTSGKQKKAWEEDSSSYVDDSLLSKPKPAAKSYAFYDAWMTVLTTMDIEPYKDVLEDPEAGAGRAFEWIAYAGIISGLIFPFTLISSPQFAVLRNMPEFQGLFGNIGTTALLVLLALAMALITPISSVIGLAISAGIQNFLAGFFGGNGNFGRTAYALAAYAAPMTILVALLGVIPLVGQCLNGLLGLYNIVLNVRALRAAHSISIWQALGVMLTPTILLMIFGCVLVFLIGLPGVSK
jgi:hypothetical protein